MRKRWYILAALAGSVAALAVWFWPHGPAWRSGPDAGELRGFSADGRILVTIHTSSGPVLSRWDAATGRLLSRATLACNNPEQMKRVQASPDGRIAVVDEGSMKDWSLERPQGEDRCYLHDGVTGERRAGPIPGLRGVAYHAFSPDGRWFCSSLAPAEPKSLSNSFGIFRSDTGDLILKTPEEDRLAAMPDGRFAPDGTSVVFKSLRFDPTAPKPSMVLHVLDLPSGRERCRLETRPTISMDIRSWDGRFLETRELGYGDDRQKHRITTRIHDLENSTLGEGMVDPLLSLELEVGASDPGLYAVLSGRSWVAYISNAGQEPPRTGWGSRIRSWFGSRRAPLQGHRVNVRIVDRTTGATRFETPRPVGYRCTVSPDGNLLACTGNEKSVEVWDLDPPPRWPKAAVLGAAVAGGALGLGWWRGRAKGKSLPCSSH